MVIDDIGCWNMCGRDRDTGNTDRNKGYRIYKKNCWDVITLLMILTSAAVIIYFGEVIKKALSINLLFFWLILQGIYLTIRRYISQDTD